MRKNRTGFTSAWAAAALLVLLCRPAAAADLTTVAVVAEVTAGGCSVEVIGAADFGLDPATLARVPGARIVVTCTSDQASHYYTVSTGLHYTAEAGRRMASDAGQFVGYGLYADAGNGPELGDGAGFGTVPGSYVGATWNHQTYIALKAPLDPRPRGLFEDRVVVTVVY